jgi:hypothetical protein
MDDLLEAIGDAVVVLLPPSKTKLGCVLVVLLFVGITALAYCAGTLCVKACAPDRVASFSDDCLCEDAKGGLYRPKGEEK